MRRLSFQWRIFWFFALIVVIIGVVTALTGDLYFSNVVFREAETRVSADLRVAHNFLKKEIEKLNIILVLLSENEKVKEFAEKVYPSTNLLRGWLQSKKNSLGLDILTLCDNKGRAILRALPPYNNGDLCLDIPQIKEALEGKSSSGICLFSLDRLKVEGEDLIKRAEIKLKPTPHARPRPEEVQTVGMLMLSAVPVLGDSGEIIGILYGGNLLNRNFQLVDYIRDMVFEEKEYRGKPLGTVTIFLEDVRIATNVIEEDGSRAIGTRVSEEVYEKVLEKGERWLGRAFVVNSWYISAYEPIYAADSSIVGMLYVGILEDLYLDMRNRFLFTFFPLIIGGIAGVLGVSYFLSRGLSEPVKRLAKAAGLIARGKIKKILDAEKKYPRIEQLPYREIQILAESFNKMAAALHERETELKRINAQLQQINRNYMEILGFVTHEIKNRLGVIIGGAYNLKGEVVGRLNPGQKKMVDILLRNAERLNVMVKNYLDLSRIERGELRVQKQRLNFKEDVVDPVVEEFKGEIESADISLEINLPDSLILQADPDLLKIVMENLLSNAIKYGRKKGRIKIGGEKRENFWQINVWNEGKGIPKDEMGKLFTKFTRLGGEELRREKGSGLGLFITKEIIEKHGGKIWAESEEGKWANFIFTLPIS
ncbi:cache domain-containing protein [Candidatus Aerophobetes bacterium]|nr:cache domain-containing protein [Candidatus Aerophobetes bacterium]